MYLVENLFDSHGERLGLELVAGRGGMGRQIKVPEAHRPGLSLSGYLKSHAGKRILIGSRVGPLLRRGQQLRRKRIREFRDFLV